MNYISDKCSVQLRRSTLLLNTDDCLCNSIFPHLFRAKDLQRVVSVGDLGMNEIQ